MWSIIVSQLSLLYFCFLFLPFSRQASSTTVVTPVVVVVVVIVMALTLTCLSPFFDFGFKVFIFIFGVFSLDFAVATTEDRAGRRPAVAAAINWPLTD